MTVRRKGGKKEIMGRKKNDRARWSAARERASASTSAATESAADTQTLPHTLVRYWAEKTFFIMAIITIADRHHTLSASEYHCCIELSSELWAAASLPPPLQTDLFVAAAVASLSFLLSFSSRLHFRRSRLRTEPRKTLSLSPSLFAHSNKQSVIMGREEREGKTCRTANPTLAPLRWHIHTLTGEADKIKKATAADSWCLVEKCRGMSALIVCTALPPVDNTPRKINDAHRRRTWDACLRE